MMLMSSYGTLSEYGEKRRHFKVNGEKHEKTIKYPEVVHNHYKYRDCIDNHNSQRMHPLSMEETWMTTHWHNRVFCFLLALTMVNVQNAANYFAKTPKMDCLSARRLIAKQLINNKYLRSQTMPKKRKKRGSIQHSLVMIPVYKKIIQGRLVSCKTKYGKWKCTDCSKFVRSYCSCTQGLMFCTDFFGNHRANLAIDNTHNT